MEVVDAFPRLGLKKAAEEFCEHVQMQTARPPNLISQLQFTVRIGAPIVSCLSRCACVCVSHPV